MTKEEYLEHVKNNELLNKEPGLYDLEDAFEAGYYHAVEMAAEYIEEDSLVYDIEGNRLSQVELDEFISNFKKGLKL